MADSQYRGEGDNLIEVYNIIKLFPPTVALDDVSFSIKRGEIHGLIGENGSGKSTMSSVITGMYRADGGRMTFNGKEWNPHNALQSLTAGIGMIVQESGTIGNISVAENIFLGFENKFKKGLFVNAKAMNDEALKVLEKVGLSSLDPSRRMNTLDFQSRKLIEVARVLYWEPQLLIIDETTTALSQAGRKLIYELASELASAGKSVLFISHDLDELMKHCHVMTILRDGHNIGQLDRAEFDSGRIKQMMVGREIQGDYYRKDTDGYSDEVVLKADCITTLKDLLCFSLELHKGEILGVGGLSHCGMHTLGRALYGEEEILDGTVVYKPKDRAINNSKIAIECGLGYVSKNRDSESLGLDSPIYENIASTGFSLNKLFGPFISFRKEKSYVTGQIDSLSIKCASPYHEVRTLSGGNKQKVVFGKWIAGGSEVLILDCPTRGVDIGVKAAMYDLIYRMKKDGKSIVLISEELPELIGMSDRIIIMKDGEINFEITRDMGLDEQKLIEYMI